jgi:VIT1/CCC1 family predicted Fe2+/Mn2+ transporter
MHRRRLGLSLVLLLAAGPVAAQTVDATLHRLTQPSAGAAGARRALPKQVKGGAIAGAIGGAPLITPFLFVDDETAGTKVAPALGAVAMGAAVGALVGLFIGSL